MTMTQNCDIFSPPLPGAPGRRLRWGRLYGAGPGLALARAAASHHGPLLVVTPDPASAQRLEYALQFFLAGSDLPLLHFPDWETLPYDVFSPHQDIVSERLATLYRLPGAARGILVVPVQTLMHRLCPAAYVQANALLLEVGQRMDLDTMRATLTGAGYRCVSTVMEHGEFAVRGNLLDLYPMGSTWPLRIELFDDEIESLRSFDPDTQRSREKLTRVRLLPAREFPLDEAAVRDFRTRYRAAFEGDPARSPVYRDVSQGLAPAGIEYYLPLFFEHTETLFDYLPETALVVTLDGTEAAAHRFAEEAAQRYEQGRHDTERPLLPPARLFLAADEVLGACNRFPRVELQSFEATGSGACNFTTQSPPSLVMDARAREPAAALLAFLRDTSRRVLFAAETSGRREHLLELLRGHDIFPRPCESWHDFLDDDAPLGITVAPLEQGLSLSRPRLEVISEPQLFGQQVMQRRRRRRAQRDADAVIRNLAELRPGAPVVHEEHGVGRYLGLQTLDVGGIAQEFLTLEYAGGDKLYVPVSALHLISRYTGAAPESAPLHKLGSGQWEKARRKAAQRVRDVAAELLEVYARREARTGFAYPVDEAAYRAFAAAFPFEETPDQQAAIDAVLAAMRSPRPMDHLVCGDVGFGKTEVAMRAAFIAVQAGRQVAVLAPTTLLTQQHLENFRDRFADWPVRVESLSRFRSRKEQEAVLAGLAEGKVDIVIGTHKLLQPDIRFKDLGLVIIDEEHRFGVRQKERFKALRAEVDVLTLTATPIPRTLNMALSGLRELSIIATPPARRLAVKTFVSEWNPHLIQEACLREIRRGGQVYFLHNDVETIEQQARKLAELVPEATVHHAHGQMRERELERVMSDFYHQRFNVLVCTTIIETGIDIPSANTIIINRADRFGLAQLYQLRGRVGRSHHRAYAYLIIPPRRALSAEAARRLEAVESIEELGTGFTLATHDLEIRGAGELLGEEQSGHMHEIGYTLYTELLERAVQALKSGREPELDKPLAQGTEIDIRAPALIPGDYLPDIHERLILYKRVANAENDEALHELQVEMVDRFGLLPPPTRTLFRLAALRLRAVPLGISKIELGPEGGRVTFVEQPDVDPARIIQLVQDDPAAYRLDPSQRLRILRELPEPEDRIRCIEELLDHLADSPARERRAAGGA